MNKVILHAILLALAAAQAFTVLPCATSFECSGLSLINRVGGLTTGNGRCAEVTWSDPTGFLSGTDTMCVDASWCG